MKEYLTISASSLSSFFKCSQMYKWQFIDMRTPDELFLFTTYGSVLHKAIELHLKYKLSLKQVIDSWQTLFIAFCSEAKGLKFPNEKELSDCLVKGLLQLGNVQTIISRWEQSEFKVLDIEKYCKIPFKNKYIQNVFLTGKLDVILNNTSDEEIRCCLDWKSSKSKEKDIDNNVQLTFYSYFISELFKTPFEKLHSALAYPIDGTILFTQRSQEDFERLFNQVHNMLERISKEDFVKEPKLNHTLGDCFFCQYKETCKKL